MSVIKLTTGYRFPHQLCLTFYIGFPVVWSDGRTYGHVITKISRMNRLPNFLRYGAQLASASRARGAPLSCNFCHFLKSAPTFLDDEFEDCFVHLYSVPCTDQCAVRREVDERVQFARSVPRDIQLKITWGRCRDIDRV